MHRRIECHGLVRNSTLYVASFIIVVNHDPQISFNDMAATTAAAAVTAEKRNFFSNSTMVLTSPKLAKMQSSFAWKE